MYDGIQLLALRLVREDDASELGPVERAIGDEDLGPERAHDRRERGGARLDDFASEDVGVDDGDVGIFEEFGDGGFAGCDAAGEADDWQKRR